MRYELKINGQPRSVDAEPGTPLLWVLRDLLDLTGTKFGCGVAACGSCTVLLAGEPVRSCQTPVEDATTGAIVTIEGANDRIATAVREAWQEKDVVQCGYCQSGQIMSAIGLLSEIPRPSDKEIDAYMDGNVCRCATYVRIKEAIKLASGKLEG
ncbi:(2Fe-2S)-binding protein [Magnetospira sp. QH-2]|uniref:(2Fe-2S)-binding protein n=1 Tax=Magnetospira sp. (strain QH-2) TaxID=1288970 RepID=UPI0003E81239|nr:(2Fe-2S)-binding protein [Magnetospira sp. QH-2]CCQ72161.1 Isoquinoline 1-oxidoreductase (iron-sulfur subunit) [Magnetospira sp. QH-2]